MVRYKIQYDPISELYVIYDTESFTINPMAKPQVVGVVTPTALSTLLAKLILHSDSVHQSISASFTQLAEEVSEDYQDYVAILSGHKQKELQSATEQMKEFSEVFVSGAREVTERFQSMLDQIQATKDMLPKAIVPPGSIRPSDT